MRKILLPILVLCASGLAQQTDWVTQIRNKPFVDAREYAFTRTNGKGATGNLAAAGRKDAVLDVHHRQLQVVSELLISFVAGGTLPRPLQDGIDFFWRGAA